MFFTTGGSPNRILARNYAALIDACDLLVPSPPDTVGDREQASHSASGWMAYLSIRPEPLQR
jgi:hypothetical protein